LVRRILENVPYGLAGPNALSCRSEFTGALKTATDLGESAPFPPDPFKDISDDIGLFRNWLKPGLTAAIANRNIPVPKRRVRHYVQRSTLSCVLLAAPAPFHDLGPLVFRNNALDLQQQVILRALPQGAVQEDYFDTGAVPLIDK
jgi:hypothetical protein